VIVTNPAASLLIIAQAQGTKVHETCIPWNDPSGDRLRDWLGIDRDTFYGDPRIAIVPHGVFLSGAPDARRRQPAPNAPQPGTRCCWRNCPVSNPLSWSACTPRPITLKKTRRNHGN